MYWWNEWIDIKIHEKAISKDKKLNKKQYKSDLHSKYGQDNYMIANFPLHSDSPIRTRITVRQSFI